MNILVDSSVLLDLLTNSSKWADWSEQSLDNASRRGTLCINDVIWAECSTAYVRIEEYRQVLKGLGLLHVPIPHEALFLAAKAFVRYRRAGGTRTSPLPDFFIGAHAAVAGIPLLTRDSRRIRSCFPTVEIIGPVPG